MHHRVDLDLKRVGLTATSSTYAYRVDHVMGELVHQLTALFASEKQDPYVFSYPATWWQHFKQRFFPAWLLRKFPVRMAEKRLDVQTLYPYLKTSLPLKAMGPRVMIMVADRSIGSFLPDTPGSTPQEWYMQAQEIISSPRLVSACWHDARHCPMCRRAWFE